MVLAKKVEELSLNPDFPADADAMIFPEGRQKSVQILKAGAALLVLVYRWSDSGDLYRRLEDWNE